MNDLKEIIKTFLLDVRIAGKRTLFAVQVYFSNLWRSLIGQTEKDYSQLRNSLIAQATDLLSKNISLQRQVDSLMKKAGKKTAAVAKKAPAKKKASGK